MIDRRVFTASLASLLAAPRASLGQATTAKVFFYASVGPALSTFHIASERAALERQGSVMLPAMVQYAWPHPIAPILYAVSSNGAPGVAGDLHHANALRIDRATGALTSHGASPALRSRPLHVSVDKLGQYLLIAYNDPSGVSVHRLNADGTIGDEVKQVSELDGGVFGHQIRVTPSNQGCDPGDARERCRER